jgi:hypothetical protein
MLYTINKEELPKDLLPYFFTWEVLFLSKMQGLKINSINWAGEDKNLKAFNSPEEYIRWFGEHPSEPVPYKNFGFYARELTALSHFIQPKVIVELGTNYGAGTFMLEKLNPQSKIYTVDCSDFHPAPENNTFPNGMLAIKNNSTAKFIKGVSWETVLPEKFNMCFIDADHSEEAVTKDSIWAWENRAEENIIIWHDVFEECPGTVRAVIRFSKSAGADIFKLKDSHCAWTYSKKDIEKKEKIEQKRVRSARQD